MTALSDDLDTPKKYGERYVRVPAEEDAVCYVGGLLAVNAAGYGVPAADTAGLLVIGRCTQGGDNTDGDDGDINFVAERGVFGYAPTAALLALGQAAVGTKVYVEDDQTVGIASDSVNKVVAGFVEEYDEDAGLFYVAVGLGEEYSGSIDGSDLGTLANAAVAPTVAAEGVPFIIAHTFADAATATYVFENGDKLEIIDVWCIKDAAGAGNTIQVTDSADAAITNAMAFAVDKTVTHAGTIDLAKRVLTAGAGYKVVNTRAAGSSAGQLFLLCIKRA